MIYAKNYDKVIIDGYTLTLEVACNNNMYMSMSNKFLVGMFRKILNCNIEKDPSIIEFICIYCKNTTLRDVNNAINIARKENLMVTNNNINKILKKGYFMFYRHTLEGI